MSRTSSFSLVLSVPLLVLAGCAEAASERVPHTALELCAPASCDVDEAPASDLTEENPCAASDETDGVACAIIDGSCEQTPYFCDEEALEICGGIAGLGCDEGEYCSFDAFTCGSGDQTGVCRPMPDACAEIYAPVCGCDGETYDNDCSAASASVSIAYRGECGAHCGGAGGVTCGDDEYCRYDVGQCLGTDASGACMPIPEACTLEYAPVCGCDGETYGNACAAAGAGVNVSSIGECG